MVQQIVHGGKILSAKDIQALRNKILRNEASTEDLMDLISSHEHLRARMLVVLERMRHLKG